VRDARVLQAKGIDYSLLDLLGGDGEATERLGDGSFVTVYLSPRDYHRLHMPAAGQLLSQTHVPGRLWSVGPHAVRALDGLLPVTPNSRSGITRKEYTSDESPTALERGAEMGRFNMGSTIIALFEHPVEWDTSLQSEAAVLMGQALNAARM